MEQYVVPLACAALFLGACFAVRLNVYRRRRHPRVSPRDQMKRDFCTLVSALPAHKEWHRLNSGHVRFTVLKLGGCVVECVSSYVPWPPPIGSVIPVTVLVVDLIAEDIPYWVADTVQVTPHDEHFVIDRAFTMADGAVQYPATPHRLMSLDDLGLWMTRLRELSSGK